MKLLLPILSIIILTLAAAHAAEEPQALQKPAPPRRPTPKWIQENDTNKNGKLDPEEIAAIKAALTSNRIVLRHRFDLDADGQMSFAEVKAMRQVLRSEKTGK